MAFGKSEAAPPAVAATAPMRMNAGLLGAIGIVGGLGAIAASSCCVIPLTFAALGAGAGVFGMLEALVSWRTPLLVTSGAWIAVAWFIWWRNHRLACDTGLPCATRSRTWAPLPLLFLATFLVVVAISWNYLEFPLLRLMRTT